MNEVSLASLVIARPGGRPRRADAVSTRDVNFRVTHEEFQRLKQMASQERRPVAAVVRDAVNTYVADYGERQVFRSVPFE